MNYDFPEYAVQRANKQNFNPYQNNGGSIVALAGSDYAVIGSDTQLCTGPTEICSTVTRDQKKLFRLSEHTVLGVAGCWCDTLTLTRLVEARMKMYLYDFEKTMSTPSCAQMLSTMLYYKRFFPFYVSSVLAGLDLEGKGCVYNFDCAGLYQRSNFCANGSAGALIQPLLDSQIGLKNIKNAKEEPAPLPREKALALLKDAFISASERDVLTGDGIYILIITADGTQEEKFELRKD